MKYEQPTYTTILLKNYLFTDLEKLVAFQPKFCVPISYLIVFSGMHRFPQNHP